MGGWLRQSTAVTLKIGPFLDDTDGKTAETGLTIAQADVRVSKNGGDMAQKNDATSCTHDELGYYDCPFNTTDTNTLGKFKYMVHEAGALPVWDEYEVVPANVWDAHFGTDKLQVDAVELSGDATAADNAEAFFDGTGYAGTGNVIPTVTTLTNAPGDSSGVATLLSRIASALTITGGKVTVGANDDKAGYSLATAPPTAGDIATAVWAAGTRTLSSFGTLVADVAAAVWGAATRTLSAFGFTPNLDPAYDAAKTAAPTGEAAAALAAYDPPTKAELDAGLADLHDFDPALEGVSVWSVVGVPVAGIEDFRADVSDLPTLAEIEGSTVLSKDATVMKAAGYVAPDNAGIATAALAAGAAVTAAEAAEDAALAAQLAAEGATAPTPAEIDAYLGEQHGTGAWGATLNDWATITPATLDDDGAALGPLTISGVATAGIVLTAYLSTDAEYATPKGQAVSDGDGGYVLKVPPGATYALLPTYDGVPFDTRTVTVA